MAQEEKSNYKLPENFHEQVVYDLPFSSKANTLELDIENTTDEILGKLIFHIDHPNWVLLKNKPDLIPTLRPGESETIKIDFDIADHAPVQKTSNLSIRVSGEGEAAWFKNITLRVNPPTKFELLQNYPNPFNPVTNIRYRLPEKMTVNISVYDITGRLAAKLLNSQQEPGAHTVQWNATSFASGVYFYRIAAETSNGENMIHIKKMLLIK